MQPIYLDTIATYFPKLYMIGAHLGWPDYMTACAVARWRPRLFFDISGGDVVQRHILEGGYIKREIRPEKLVYGSDCDLRRLKDNVQGWKRAFDELGLSEEEQDLIFIAMPPGSSGGGVADGASRTSYPPPRPSAVRRRDLGRLWVSHPKPDWISHLHFCLFWQLLP